MKFYKHLLDPTKNRKIKGLVLSTTLLTLGFIDANTWAFTFFIFVGGTSGEKIADVR